MELGKENDIEHKITYLEEDIYPGQENQIQDKRMNQSIRFLIRMIPFLPCIRQIAQNQKVFICKMRIITTYYVDRI